MPRTPRRALVWSDDARRYELYSQGQLDLNSRVWDQATLLTWLCEATSFAFHSPAGSLNVYHEARTRGGSYWYAYHTSHGRTHKRYLGSTESISLARLEEAARELAHGHSTPAVSKQSPTPIATTRLTAPRLPNALVPRTRLLTALHAALTTPLTLLSASAGWGKTTLLAGWASQHTVPIAWLSLDELDNSPTRFWVALIAALRRCGRYEASLGETALALLQSPQPPPLSACLSALLNDLERGETAAAPSTPIVLILDDYQVISDPTIHEGMAFWLEHLPAHLHVILASRVDPDLPLARLRARGQLTEIRADDLRFGVDEAGDFLSHLLSPTLSDDEVRQLTQRTEGWVAGLQLAALALQKRADRADRATFLHALAGSQRYLVDYVQEDILARLPTHLRDFLLQTAILTRLEAEVCQAVTAATDRHASQHMLEELERANLFLVPLDEERHWYRLHDLFREAVLAALEATYPDLPPILHRRAASYYEAHGEWGDAVAHWLAAADYFAAARLMEQAAPRYWLNGEAQTVQAWIAALPDAVMWEHAQLALKATLRLLESLAWTTEATYARAQALMEPLLARLEALVLQDAASQTDAGGVSEPELEAIERRLHLLRALLGTRAIVRRRDQTRLAELARDIAGLAQGEDVSWQMIPLIVDCWLTEGFRRQGALLLPRILEAREQAERVGELLASLRVRSWLATAYTRARAWPQVEQESLAALALLGHSGVRSPVAGYLRGHLANAYYAWNRLDEAAVAVQETLRIGHDWEQVDLLISGGLGAAQVYIARGDLADAELMLRQAEELVQREQVTLPLSSPVAAFRVQYWLAAGDLEAASHWAEHAAFSPDRWDANDQWAVRMLARVRLAEHRPRYALDLLERFRAPLNRPGDTLSAIEWLALQVVTLYEIGEREQSDEALTQLVALTEPVGDLRVYLDLGEPMRQALMEWRASRHDDQPQSSSATAYVLKLLSAFDYELHGASQLQKVPTPRVRLSSPSPETSASSSAQSAPSALGASLTAREQVVLRLLATGASNQEIAQTLVISMATVKKHVSNLLGKLEVTSRTQAIAQARSRALL